MITNKLKDEYIKPFAGVVRVEPSSSCNLRCSHCPTGTLKLDRGIMTIELFDRILSDIKRFKDSIRVVVLYHGGEPLLNKHLPLMIRTLKENDFPFVKTVSNGKLLTESLSTDLVRSDLDWIEVSLDGESFDENNNIRRSCDGKQVLDNLKKMIDIKRGLSSSKPAIYLATTQFKKEYDNFVEQPPFPEYIKEYLSGYLDDIAGYKSNFAMKWPEMNVDTTNTYDIITNPEKNRSNYCDHVNNTLTIRWNGDVVPCCYDLTSSLVMGNIRSHDLSTIWNNQAFRDLRKSIDQRKLVSPCKYCNLLTQEDYLILKNTQ